ncbi:MAG: prepilin peptidase [Candidatus Cloacimonadota bacterium]|nr:MAG: prepilin peptidase [Candidatus Cloacimonadota bacterium]
MVILLILFLLGLCIGSFLNVVIYRLPKNESIIYPSSHCPFCNHKIAFYDNIPLLSFIILGGRCRNCKKRISFQYPLVEFICGIILPLSFLYYGFSLNFFATSLFLYLLLPIFFIDLKHQVISDKITIPGIIIGFAFSFFLETFHWLGSLIGIAVGGGILLLTAVIGKWVFKKEAMGMGDVMLFMMVGAFLGWKGVLLTLILASFLGSIIGGIILTIKKKKDTVVPFGPFISIAAAFSYFWGTFLIEKYLSLFR